MPLLDGIFCISSTHAQRALAQWERKFLAAQLKLDFDDEEREELFLSWNVHRESKERKMQLVRKLWAPDQTGCCSFGRPLPFTVLQPDPNLVQRSPRGASSILQIRRARMYDLPNRRRTVCSL